MNKQIEKYDILSKAKRKGQSILIAVERPARKDNPIRIAKGKIVEQHRQEIKNNMGQFYEYCNYHPELCPPVGTVINIRNQYGIKAKIIVTDIFRGLPVTINELLPIEEQPEQYRDPTLLAEQLKGLSRPNWNIWSDDDAWDMWQGIQNRSLTPWLEDTEWQWPKEKEPGIIEKAVDLISEVMGVSD